MTQATSASVAARRSGKVPDPPIFYNEEDRDTITFEQWHRAVENKLAVNADHFLTDRALQVYIESRIGGTAKSELSPYLRKTHPNPITTPERLMDHLWEQYFDPMTAQRSKDEYEDLRMKPGSEFLAFKNDFVRLAGECGRPRADWKDEFNRRLTPALQRSLAHAFLDDSVDFDAYARLGLQHTRINKRAAALQAAARSPAGTLAGSHAGGSTPGKTNRHRGKRDDDSAAATSGNSSASNGKPLTPEEHRVLAREGRCFRCRQKGHMSPDCPKKKETAVNATEDISDDQPVAMQRPRRVQFDEDTIEEAKN
ncbi:hypothetical protein C8A05DRAFT_20576 [Staphylotrichum tortipilum]|uniref:CCHC-type domain-containing protein n=1 Tax=Staphylotrichum tortipilum TaxID=2831512 RepID=A0AAN6RLQ5_9PEZI|nr:hypothetical protein C8A05DRAFT_20576 [Staphylotrichum longicolle]